MLSRFFLYQKALPDYGDIIPICKVTWLLRTVCLLMLILTSIYIIDTGYSIQFWALFLFSYAFFIIIWFIPISNELNHRARDKRGINKTEKKNLKEKFKKEGGIEGYQQIDENHKALIFISNHKDNYAEYNYKDIRPIINECNIKNEKYRIYFCYLVEDFKKIVQSKYVYEIHIYGHGRIDSLGFQDGIMQYRELKDTKPKELIAQWHCNHGNKEETSLGYYIGKTYHVPYGYQLFPDIKNNVQKFIDGKIKPKVNTKFMK